MKREILFRGKRIDTGEWIEGDLVHDYWIGGSQFLKTAIRFLIDQIYSFPVEVNHETIGQFTGLTDKNGVKIFEGDILKTATGKPMIVGWSYKFASFVLNRDGWAFSHWFGESCNPEDCEVIGNLHDNPELLK